MKLPFSVRIEEKTRFPLISVPGTNYEFAWLPLTKIQVEYFLCQTPDSQFDRSWYQECLKGSPRVTMEQLGFDTVRHVFMGNLLFQEARILSRYWGRDFDLPTMEEWRKALVAFDQVEARDDFIEEIVAMPDLHPRARLLLHRVEQILKDEPRPRSRSTRFLSHQLLMRSGIAEYAYKDEYRNVPVACGSLRRFSDREGSFEESFVTQLRRADWGERVPNLGFRLIARGKERG